ncbi:MAG: acyl-CoA synthetase FdrA, partial [Hyphomicrobiaceae bacterium]
GLYLDSVALMRMSRTIASMEGVEEAALMMGTASNREIMAEAGLLAEAGEAASGGDLIIGVRATTRQACEAALTKAIAQLEQPAVVGNIDKMWRPKNVSSAVKHMPEASLALISVPGDFAVAQARKAIRHGLDVMIFSDNVALSEEAALKREARELGRLVMGPDCGTAIINGVPLAFANCVNRGNIGLIGASGTGMQEISCLIDRYGGGISHAIGVGGRDLNATIGGISTLMALDALIADTMTEKIVLVSKPPPKDVAARVLERIGQSNKPAIICFIGADEMAMPANVTQVATLKAAANSATGRANDEATLLDPAVKVPPTKRLIKGLFSGGTLCAEAQVLLRSAGESVCSNAPIPGVPLLDKNAGAHPILDLGDDQFTRGKPHPMIDPSVRDGAFGAALRDPAVGVVLLDIVIGHGAHPDPAGHLATFLAGHSEPDRPVLIASVTGTDDDPQNRSAQVAKLVAAGVNVVPTNADAANWAAAVIRS